MTIASPRRLEIEQAASSLFRRRGYAATSVRDIARELDLQGGSLYAHMASKEEILWAIADRIAGRFEAAGELLADRSRSVPERVEAWARAHVDVVTSDVEAASVFVFEWRSLSTGRRDAMLARRDAYEARLRRAIEEGAAQGELAPAVDPRFAAAFVLTALNGIASWYRRDGPEPARRVADDYARLVLAALGARHLGTARVPASGSRRP